VCTQPVSGTDAAHPLLAAVVHVGSLKVRPVSPISLAGRLKSATDKLIAVHKEMICTEQHPFHDRTFFQD
jgi:hypothetical protein